MKSSSSVGVAQVVLPKLQSLELIHVLEEGLFIDALVPQLQILKIKLNERGNKEKRRLGEEGERIFEDFSSILRCCKSTSKELAIGENSDATWQNEAVEEKILSFSALEVLELNVRLVNVAGQMEF